MKCRTHDWHATPRASTPSVLLPGELVPQKCDACGTRYPCAHACEHFDCRTERGEPLPEWAGGVTSDASAPVEIDTSPSISESGTPSWLVGMS